MLKPKFYNILLFFLVKYIAFYVFMMFKNNDFTLVGLNELKNSKGWFYYLWIFLFLPVVCGLIFSAPIYFMFKVRNVVLFLFLISTVLIAEYLLYTYFASEADLMNGVYNAVISILFLLLLFFKSIRLKFN
jgi:hypothetical protein